MSVGYCTTQQQLCSAVVNPGLEVTPGINATAESGSVKYHNLCLFFMVMHVWNGIFANSQAVNVPTSHQQGWYSSNTLNLYFGRAWHQSQLGHCLITLRVVVLFLCPYMEMS